MIIWKKKCFWKKIDFLARPWESTKKFQPIRSSRLAGYREHIKECLVLLLYINWLLSKSRFSKISQPIFLKDFFTMLGWEHPELFYSLPCSLNYQTYLEKARVKNIKRTFSSFLYHMMVDWNIFVYTRKWKSILKYQKSSNNLDL